MNRYFEARAAWGALAKSLRLESVPRMFGVLLPDLAGSIDGVPVEVRYREGRVEVHANSGFSEFRVAPIAAGTFEVTSLPESLRERAHTLAELARLELADGMVLANFAPASVTARNVASVVEFADALRAAMHEETAKDSPLRRVLNRLREVNDQARAGIEPLRRLTNVRVPVLEADLLRIAGDPRAEPAQRAAAIRQIVLEYDPVEAAGIILNALHGAKAAEVIVEGLALMSVLAYGEEAVLLDPFVAIAIAALDHRDSDVRSAAAAALGAARILDAKRRTEIEAILLGRLSSDERGGVKAAAIETLGLIGSVSCVEPIRQTRDVARATVDAAVRRIQARVDGAAPGQVSLAEGFGGELAIIGVGAGALSPPDPKDD